MKRLFYVCSCTLLAFCGASDSGDDAQIIDTKVIDSMKTKAKDSTLVEAIEAAASVDMTLIEDSAAFEKDKEVKRQELERMSSSPLLDMTKQEFLAEFERLVQSASATCDLTALGSFADPLGEDPVFNKWSTSDPDFKNKVRQFFKTYRDLRRTCAEAK